MNQAEVAQVRTLIREGKVKDAETLIQTIVVKIGRDRNLRIEKNEERIKAHLAKREQEITARGMARVAATKGKDKK